MTAEPQVRPELATADGTLEAALPGLAANDPLLAVRRQAWETYRKLPMPTRKSEEWRYTDLSGLKPESYAPFAPEAACPEMARPDAAMTLPASVQAVLDSGLERSAIAVRVNGVLVHQELDPELEARGVVFAPLGEVVRTRPELLHERLFASSVAEMERKLWSLHIALLSGGTVLYVPAGVVVPHPVHAFHTLDEGGSLISTHSLVVAETNAEVICIEEFMSPDLELPALSLAGAEIFGGDGAGVRHLVLQRYGRGVKHFFMGHATSARDARLSSLSVSLGADLSRADITSHLVGAGGDSEMLALWLGDGDQHFDYHTLQEHAAPNAHSDLLYKGALCDSAESVFRGLIRVDPGAQLTDAYQTNRNLLLSKDARAIALPSLEIEADDVRCSHGASVGQVDAAQLFYLMSRGLSRPEAERLLVLGFLDEVLQRVSVKDVRERIRTSIEERIRI